MRLCAIMQSVVKHIRMKQDAVHHGLHLVSLICTCCCTLLVASCGRRRTVTCNSNDLTKFRASAAGLENYTSVVQHYELYSPSALQALSLVGRQPVLQNYEFPPYSFGLSDEDYALCCISTPDWVFLEGNTSEVCVNPRH